MRIFPLPQACSGLLCGLSILMTGCGNPSWQNLTSLTVTVTPSNLTVGSGAILKAIAHLSNGTTQDVTAGTQWTLSNPALAAMGSGALTAKAAGTLTVQATYLEAAPAGSSASASSVTPETLNTSAQVNITATSAPAAPAPTTPVSQTAPTITWNAPPAISYGTALSSTQLSATANVPGTFAYSPATGTLVKAGTQVLSATFTPTETQTYSTATASVNLTVAQATPVITFPAPAPISAGTALSATQLNATANVPGSFRYSPSAGAVLAAGQQPLTAVFSPTDSTNYLSTTAHTSLQVNSSRSSGPGGGTLTPTAPAPTPPVPPVSQTAPTVTWSAPPAISYGTALSSTQLSATANVPGTFAYSPAAGTVLKAGSQILSATFTPTDTQTYSTATASVKLVVAQATPVITWPAPAPISTRTALSATQLNATANVAGSFLYSPAAGAVLTAGTQALTAVFSPTDSSDYLSATVYTSLLVHSPRHSGQGDGPVTPTPPTAPTITWSTPPAISYGTALSSTQLSATANVPGTFAYSPGAGSVLKSGSQILSATFTPTDTQTYSTANASVKLTVAQATPVISWPAPAPISTGIALSATQLNATANVAGSFLYSPAAGAVLAAGTQPLTAVFSPTDSGDYLPATAHTSLVVNSPPPSSPVTPPAPPTAPTPAGPPPAPTGCGGSTINLNSTMSQSTLQNTIASAPTCALIVFAAGTYNISGTLNIPCASKLTLTGPAASPASAILNATFTGASIFGMGGCSRITIWYLGFENTEGIYVNVPSSGSSGIDIEHNQFFNLPGNSTSLQTETGIYFDGYTSGGTLSNVTINWNNFGSPNDCNGAMTQQADQGGYCAGITFTSTLNTITVTNNTFLHLEEGFHVNCTQSGCEPPSSNTWKNFTATNNDFSEIHRIGMEMQPQPSDNVVIQYNSLHDFINGYYSTMGISSACCDTGATSPGTIDSNNVLIANIPAANAPPEYIPFAIEFWGNGSLAQNNLIQGYWSNGITFGYAPNAVITDNNICGSVMAASNWFVSNEEHQATPTISSNTTSATCSTVSSVAPSISPAAVAISEPTTITLSETGTNHSIYYTTNGSTPTTASTLYSGPFSVGPGTTVKAVGMWGQGANAKSYPAGYGYVPSAVVTATYAVSAMVPGPAARASVAGLPRDASSVAGAEAAPAENPGVALESIAITPSQPAVAIGSTTQLKAVATFNDGSVKDVTSGFAWQSSDPRTITVSASGLMSGLATGPAVISGSYQERQASVSAGSSIGELDWSGPIVISEGGAYSGNWQSTDAKTPAVTIATTAPVIIENSHIRSVGGLIKTTVKGSNVTVRNSVGVAGSPAVSGQPNGIFLEVSSPLRLDVENNYIENVQAGVIVHGYGGNRDGEQTIVIHANRARNLIGLLSDGNGGYLPGEASDRNQSHFIQFDSVKAVPGIDVGWNEVINYPGRSMVGDNIDIYRSGGTPNRPLEIHDTYIQSAYPFKAAQDAYRGGGIKTDAKAGDGAEDVPAFNNIHDNQVVGTVNYGIQFAAGHDNIAANNRIISSGLLADGTRIRAQYVGMANGDAAGSAVANGSMYNNAMRDNLIGWACWRASCAQEGYRKDQYFPASPADYSANSVLPAGQVTLEMENNEYQVWINKQATAGITVGPSF
jgi:Chitobiase/beta-hexosaminidase C-terminal domain/Bacterial Ig-like domain (group 2)